jgi:hypothetical protein
MMDSFDKRCGLVYKGKYETKHERLQRHKKALGIVDEPKKQPKKTTHNFPLFPMIMTALMMIGIVILLSQVENTAYSNDHDEEISRRASYYIYTERSYDYYLGCDNLFNECSKINLDDFR